MVKFAVLQQLGGQCCTGHMDSTAVFGMAVVQWLSGEEQKLLKTYVFEEESVGKTHTLTVPLLSSSSSRSRSRSRSKSSSMFQSKTNSKLKFQSQKYGPGETL